MKTLEEKEAEFKEYVIGQLNVLTGPKCIAMEKAIRSIAHNLIQDFKEETESFNTVMEEELTECKEQIERFKEAYNTFKSEVEE